MKVACCVLLLFFVPLGSAETLLLEDSALDHGAPAWFEEGDLRSLHAELEGDRLTFRIETQGLAAPAEVPVLDSAWYYIHFQRGEMDYRIEVERRIHARSNTEGPAHDGLLQILAGGTQWQTQNAPVEITEDTAAGTLEAQLIAGHILDERGLPFRPGDSLVAFWVTSTNEIDTVRGPGNLPGLPTDSLPTVHDRMPDTETGSIPFHWALQPGDSPIMLNTPTPMRFSNGGPTTFVFEVEAKNPTDEATELSFILEEIPETWLARIAPETFTLEGGETRSVSIVLQVQGQHDHGGDDLFRLLANSPTGTSTLELGIHYPEIAQPAGHHNTVWFHSRADSPGNDLTDPFYTASDAAGLPLVRTWINTAEEDSRDQSARAGRNSGDLSGWRLPLSPGLLMGLQIINETGEVHVPLQPMHSAPVEDVVLQATLYHKGSNGTHVLAKSDPSDPTNLPAGTVTPILLPLHAETLLVEHEPGASMWLDITLVSRAEEAEDLYGLVRVALMPGGYAKLPLGEYRDPLPTPLAKALKEEGILDVDGTLITDPAGASAAGRGSPLGAPILIGALLVALASVLRRRASSLP